MESSSVELIHQQQENENKQRNGMNKQTKPTYRKRKYKTINTKMTKQAKGAYFFNKVYISNALIIHTT